MMWHSPINFDNILFVIANDNNISSDVAKPFEHNDFPCKLVIKIIIAMFIFSISAIKRKVKKKISSNNNKK